MVLFKKLIFAPLFLLLYALLIFQLNPLFSSYDAIFSLSFNTLIQLITLSALIILTSLMFTLFATLSQDWKLVVPVGLVAAILPLVLIAQPLGIILAMGTFLSILICYFTLENSLNSYLTFNVNSLLGPSIRHFITLLILIFVFSYFLSINKLIQKEGFQIPDSLIDTALKFASPTSSSEEQKPSPTLPSLSKEQIDLLKKNPNLLKQYGLDPKILDSLNQPQGSNQQLNPTNDLIKQTVKAQLQNIIKPYLGFIPALLAVILFLTLQSIVSLMGLLIYPLLWLIFFIFEKTGFVSFTEEMRPVKKMVV